MAIFGIICFLLGMIVSDFINAKEENDDLVQHNKNKR